MAFADNRVIIQVSPELRRRLKVIVAEKGFKSYEDMIVELLKYRGYWKEESPDEQKE